VKKIIPVCAAFALLLGMAGPANATIIADFGTLTVVPSDSDGDTTSFAAGANIDNQYLFRIDASAQVITANVTNPGKANVVVELDPLLYAAADGPIGRQGATVPEHDKQRPNAPRQGFAVSGHGSPTTDTIPPKRPVLQKRLSVGTTTTSPLLSRILLSSSRPFSTSE